MFLQNSMPTRRQFLERSALGAGSVLFLPGLLTSCTDHVIPNPNSPIFPPSLPDDSIDIDWNDAAKIAVVAGLEKAPVVGDILGPLVDIFWPENKPDVWDQVKDRVEALVDQKIADNVYSTVKDDLGGLRNVLADYMLALKNSTPSEILTQWQITKTHFDNARPHFQSAGYELPLSSLFVQFANMYLFVLRDPLVPVRDSQGNIIRDLNGNEILTGNNWKMTDADLQQLSKDLKTNITNFTAWTYSTYKDNGRVAVIKNAPTDNHKCEPFRSVNAYDRQMTLMVLDHMNTWPYYDVTQYPNGAKNPDGTPINVLIREIYSDPYGTCDNSGPIVYPSLPTQAPTNPMWQTQGLNNLTVPTQLPTNLTVWGGDRIQAVQLTYPANSGPGGVTTTPRMGAGGGSNQPPRGGSFNISPDNPIVQGGALYGDIVNALQFQFNNGTLTDVLGNGYVDPVHPPTPTNGIRYPNNALSSVWINGVSHFYQSADCVVFGFQYWQSPTAKLNAIRNMYVKSPKEHSVADFVKSFPKLAIPADLITDELKAARRKHWESIEARAKALK